MAKSEKITVDLTRGDGIPHAIYRVSGDDTLYYRFVSDGASAPTTAVISMYSHRHADEPPLLVGTLTLDGTIGTPISLTGFEFISFAVTTVEAAKNGRLFFQTRKTQE